MRNKGVFLFALFVVLMSGFVVASDSPDFNILNIYPVSDSSCVRDDGVIKDDCNVEFDVVVENKGASGNMKMELGIHKNSWLRDAGYTPLSVVSDIPNCVSGEDNVDSKEVFLDADDFDTIRFQVRSPTTSDDLDKSYGVTSVAFMNCAGYGDDAGVTSAPYTSIVIGNSESWFGSNIGNPLFDGDRNAETCFDNQRNQDETDIDCGGSCVPCEDGEMCKLNKDCQEHASCISGRCKPLEDTSTEEHVVSGLREFGVGLLKYGVPALALLLFAGLFWFVLKRFKVVN